MGEKLDLANSTLDVEGNNNSTTKEPRGGDPKETPRLKEKEQPIVPIDQPRNQSSNGNSTSLTSVTPALDLDGLLRSANLSGEERKVFLRVVEEEVARRLEKRLNTTSSSPTPNRAPNSLRTEKVWPGKN